MPASTIFVLVGVVAAFAAFAGVLAWAQLCTRHPAIAGEAAKPHKKRPFWVNSKLPRFADFEKQTHG
jgi:hypothetical protein